MLPRNDKIMKECPVCNSHHIRQRQDNDCCVTCGFNRSESNDLRFGTMLKCVPCDSIKVLFMTEDHAFCNVCYKNLMDYGKLTTRGKRL